MSPVQSTLCRAKRKAWAGLTMSNQAGICKPWFCLPMDRRVRRALASCRNGGRGQRTRRRRRLAIVYDLGSCCGRRRLTMDMGVAGACGRTNLTSFNELERRQC